MKRNRPTAREKQLTRMDKNTQVYLSMTNPSFASKNCRTTAQLHRCIKMGNNMATLQSIHLVKHATTKTLSMEKFKEIQA